MEKIIQALVKIREAEILMDEAAELLSDYQINLCRAHTKSYTTTNAVQVHTYDGIKKLAAAAGKELVHPEYRSYFSNKYDDFVIGFELDDVFYYTIDPAYKGETEDKADDIPD